MAKILILIYDQFYNQVKESAKKIPFDFVYHKQSDINALGVDNYFLKTVDDIKSGKLDIHAVVGVNEGNCVLAMAINSALGFRDNVSNSIYFQNKYISRMKQREIIPGYIPQFSLASNCDTFPNFVKPARSSLSSYATLVCNNQDLDDWIKKHKSDLINSNEGYLQFLNLGLFSHEDLETYNDFICESVIQGEQCTVDGYVFNGKIVFFGITLSLLMPNKVSFYRFDFPHTFGEVDKKIYFVATSVIDGFGLDNTTFNMELMVDGDDVKLIEVHCRSSFQFIPLIEAVTGYNMLNAACKIALGIDPNFVSCQSDYKIASSCVLRRDSDGFVTKVPTEEKASIIASEYDSRIGFLARRGSLLSDYPQDSKTFRYAIIDIPGCDHDDIEGKLSKIISKLDFEFAP